jgi:hypothetical protein
VSGIVRAAGRHGKLARKSDFRTLRFGDYLQGSLPPVAVAADNLSRALTAIKATEAEVPELFPMDDNDTLGLCTICGVAHGETLYDAFVGRRVVAAASLVKSTYFSLSGGQDSGLVMLDVLKWWRKNRFNGDNILAFVSVDPKNLDHVKLAIQMFGGLYTGIQCSTELDQQFEAGVPWTPGKLTNDGHCIFTHSFDADGTSQFTWGNTQKGTWPWWHQAVDEAYALLPPEAMLPGFSPLWNWSQLNADLRMLTN